MNTAISTTPSCSTCEIDTENIGFWIYEHKGKNLVIHLNNKEICCLGI